METFIFSHNHPSGGTNTPAVDIKLIKRLAEAGQVVGIEVLYPIIFGDKNYLSLKGKGSV